MTKIFLFVCKMRFYQNDKKEKILCFIVGKNTRILLDAVKRPGAKICFAISRLYKCSENFSERKLFKSVIFYLPIVLNTSRACYVKRKETFDLNLVLKVSCRPYGRQSSAK